MEFLKHEMFMPEAEPQSGIRRTANHYMTANPVFEQERDDVTRQRLLFSAILCDHFEVLFNGNSNERGPLWEEVRQFMIEQGAMTLVDKDWKYVASCYWQNIRKESIRRMAKMKVGAIKTARPGQLDLDRLVGEVINKRGPGSLESVVNNYGRAYADEEMQNTNMGASNGQPQPAEAKTQQQQIIILEEPLSNSASPAALEEGNNQQPILDQLIRSASLKYTPNQPQTQHQPITVTGPTTSSNSNAGNNFSAGHQQPTAGGRGRDGNVANASAADVVETASFQLGKMVAKTHSLLLGGGYMEMATEFEQQMKQMVNGYKAWMFDQIFPQGNAEEDGLTSGGAGGSADSPPKAKKAKLG